LAGLDNVKVLGVDLLVLWEVEVLLCDKYALTEQVLVDLLAVGLWNKHLGGLVEVLRIVVVERSYGKYFQVVENI